MNLFNKPDFLLQKLAIKKITIYIKKIYTGYWFIYYVKFLCKLNSIEYIWYNSKSWTLYNYKSIIEELRKDIPKVLNLIKFYSILKYYKISLKKIDINVKNSHLIEKHKL